jgi:hypothetical protein
MTLNIGEWNKTRFELGIFQVEAGKKTGEKNKEAVETSKRTAGAGEAA